MIQKTKQRYFGENHCLYERLCAIAYMIFKESEATADAFSGIVQKEDRLDLVGQSIHFVV